MVEIRRGVVLGRRGVVEKDTKTHAVRRVALDPAAVRYLVDHRDRSEHVATLCGMPEHLGEVLALVQQTVTRAQLADDLLGV